MNVLTTNSKLTVSKVPIMNEAQLIKHLFYD